MTIEEFKRHYEKVTGWKIPINGKCRCPTHDDRTASLSVKQRDDGRILLCCDAGCKTEEVCAALVLKVSDLMPANKSNRHSSPPPGPGGNDETSEKTKASLDKVINDAEVLKAPEAGGSGATPKETEKALRDPSSATTGSSQIILEFKPSGNQVNVSASHQGDVIFVDIINAAKSRDREDFASEVVKKIPEADAKEIDLELMNYAAERDRRGNGTPDAGDGTELTGESIVRPELFFTDTCCGLTLAVSVERGDGQCELRQWQYLQWADGRREQRPFQPILEIEKRKVFFHPPPSGSIIGAACPWSRPSRDRWLGNGTIDMAVCFRALRDTFDKFLFFSSDKREAITSLLALYVIFTYFYSMWEAVPYLRISGPKGSGKSQVLRILERLVFKPLKAESISAAALFRQLDAQGGTFLMDEAQSLWSNTPGGDEIKNIVLTGYKRGGNAARLEKVGEKFEMRNFYVFGPKVFSGTSELPDAVEDRCISISMFRSPPGSSKPRRRLDKRRTVDIWQLLRDSLYTAALEYGLALKGIAFNSKVCPAAIEGRKYELWQPILALASWLEKRGCKGLLDIMQKFAIENVSQSNEANSATPQEELLLQKLTELLQQKETPTPAELLDAAAFKDSKLFEKWNSEKVGRTLSKFGLKTIRSNGKRQYRSSLLENLGEIQRSYGVPLGVENSITEPPYPTPCKKPALTGTAPVSNEEDRL